MLNRLDPYLLRLRHRGSFTFLILILILTALTWNAVAQTQGAIGEVSADSLIINTGGGRFQELVATGNASIQYSDQRITADEFKISQEQQGAWMLLAQGNVVLTDPNRTIRAERLVSRLELLDGQLRLQQPEVMNFSVEEPFTNSEGKVQVLRYQGTQSVLSIDSEGQVDRVEMSKGAVTACSCSVTDLRQAGYSLTADRVLIFPGDLLVAYNITFRIFGVPIIWYPVHILSLRESVENSLVPVIELSQTRGLHTRLTLPFYTSRRTFGFLFLDYYSLNREIGPGLEFNYAFQAHEGDLSLYWLTSVTGTQTAFLNLDWSHELQLSDEIELSLLADYRNGQFVEETDEHLTNEITLAGDHPGWAWEITADSDIDLEKAIEDGSLVQSQSVQLPEITITKDQEKLGKTPFNYTAQAGWGRFRELEVDLVTLTQTLEQEAARLDGNVTLGLDRLTALSKRLGFSADLRARYSDYETPGGVQTDRTVLEFISKLDFTPVKRLKSVTNYTYRQVDGASPLSFDVEKPKNRIGEQVTWSTGTTPGWQANLKTGYNFWDKTGNPKTTGNFEPLKGSLTYRTSFSKTTAKVTYNLNPLVEGKPVILEEGILTNELSQSWWSLTTEATYDFIEDRLDQLELNGKLSRGGVGLSASTVYDFPTGTQTNSIFKLGLGDPEQSQLLMGLNYNLNTGEPLAINLETQLMLSDRWQITLNGEYDFSMQTPRQYQIGVTRFFCERCWELEILANVKFETDDVAGEPKPITSFTILTNFNAFPVIREKYQPTDEQLDVEPDDFKT
ncbi:MAG: hypothetical protein ACE5JP_07980 [Candidatus Bipolaricaulia bacterium]